MPALRPFDATAPRRARRPVAIGAAIVILVGIVAAVASANGDDPAPLPAKGFKLADVTGKHAAEAATILDRSGLKIRSKEAKGSKAKAGTVVAMDPKARSRVERGDTVTLSVAPGPKAPAKVKVPNVSGMAVEDAKAALRKAGFGLKKTQYRYDHRDTGTVIKTAPSAGTSADKGSMVTVYAAKKRPDPAPPTVAPANRAPMASDQTEYLSPAGSHWTIWINPGTVRDADADSWKIASYGHASKGKVTFTRCSADPEHGCFHYDAGPDGSYKDSFTYQVTDSSGAKSNVATIHLCVRCVG